MANKLVKYLLRGRSSNSGSSEDSFTGKAAGFSKARTASRTNTTILVNKTGSTLMLRDKIGPSYGQVRYRIEKDSQIEVSSVQHTFYKMLAYAIEEATEGEEEAGGRKKKTVFKDTKLSIDSDELADYKKIVICCVDKQYKVKKFRDEF